MTFEARYIDISQWTSSVNKQTHCSIAASEQYDGSTNKPHGYQLKQKFWLLRKSLTLGRPVGFSAGVKTDLTKAESLSGGMQTA